MCQHDKFYTFEKQFFIVSFVKKLQQLPGIPITEKRTVPTGWLILQHICMSTAIKRNITLEVKQLNVIVTNVGQRIV